VIDTVGILVIFIADSVSGAQPVYSVGAQYFTGRRPQTLRSGDLNGDGLVDLVATNSSDDDLSVFFGNGDGTFGDGDQETAGVLVPAGAGAWSVTIADFDGDTIADLATANTDGDDISVILGAGGGLFEPQVNYQARESANDIVHGDLNDDGFLDLVVANTLDDSLSVFIGNGDGTFRSQTVIDGLARPESVLAVDLDDDGALDLVTASERFEGSSGGFNGIGVLYGRNDGTFDDLMVLETKDANAHVGTADFNADGYLDIATANISGGDAAILLGRGGRAFGMSHLYNTSERGQSAIPADLNLDGFPDLLIASGDRNPAGIDYGVSVLINQLGIAESCPADFSGNGVADCPDIGLFLGAFAASDPAADLTGDGSVSFPDVGAFLAAFAAGCP